MALFAQHAAVARLLDQRLHICLHCHDKAHDADRVRLEPTAHQRLRKYLLRGTFESCSEGHSEEYYKGLEGPAGLSRRGML
jgi:hypothetical protein